MLIDAIKSWEKLLLVYHTASELQKAFGDINHLNQNIQTAINLDETNITAMMILKNSLQSYTKGTKFSFDFLLSNREKLFKFISAYDELNEKLSSKTVTDEIDKFRNRILDDTGKSGFTMDKDFTDFVNDDFSLAEIRLSALNSFKNLRIDQFSSGKSATDNKVFNTKDVVFEFTDINFLLREMKSNKLQDGVYVCSIKDPDDYRFSFFVFAIKNGENIYIVSDKPDLPTPNYKRVGRGRAIDKRFETRVNTHFFPYELLVEYDSNSERYVQTKKEYTDALSLRESGFSILGYVDKCNPESKLWLMMMFGLFSHKYFVENTPQMEMSYTNLMIEQPSDYDQKAKNVDETAIITSANAALISYTGLPLEEINTHLSTNENDELWHSEPTHKNDWMVERYGNEIKKLNVKALLSAPNEDLKIDKSQNLVSNPIEEWHAAFDGSAYLEVKDIKLSDFGKKKEIVQNLKWQARYVQSRQIAIVMQDEFNNTNKEIKKWYQNAVEKNIANIRKAIAKGEFLSRYERNNGFMSKDINEEKNILTIYSKEECTKRFDSFHFYKTFSLAKYKPNHSKLCYFTEKPWGVVVELNVTNAQAMADVCGLSGVNDLPEILRHYTARDPYHGNSILDFIDPMETIKDPWMSIKWDVFIFISASEMNRIKKEK